MDDQIKNIFKYVTASEDLKCRTYERITSRPRRRIYALRRWSAALACCMAVLLFGGFGAVRVYGAQTALISIDMNPSIELGLNRFGRVIKETAYGEDGEFVLAGVSLRNLTYEEALEALLTSPETNGYLEEGALVSITLETGENPNSQLFASVETCVDQLIADCHEGVTANYCHADSGTAEEAHEHELSVGKYLAIQELLEADPSATMEEYRDCPMEEIEAHTHLCHGDSSEVSGHGCGEQNSAYDPTTDGGGTGDDHELTDSQQDAADGRERESVQTSSANQESDDSQDPPCMQNQKKYSGHREHGGSHH